MNYLERAEHTENKVAKKLLTLMAEKQTNLSLSADVTSAAQLIQLADSIGPEICLLKTHIDIIEDFTPELTKTLKELANQHQFLIFEDRKFADIGNTVHKQFTAGIYKISSWANIINAHMLPGPGIIDGLKKDIDLEKTGLLLLAQMSSAGNLLHSDYTKATVNIAKTHNNFVMGFISREKLSDDPGMIHMTPGVQLQEGQDALGQRYLTPEHVIDHLGNDIIIVGRGIYDNSQPLKMAQSYRQAGWQAYLKRL
ncbi:orotidine 5'-phosphate decarboxylase [Piscirickettsia salmonis]|uniref:orotidine-5'-phosphate decarboxylase n=1 Tax=Piscirickettsia salmonis TaxID=1238 RepID=UPI0012B7709A|nr:orotidine-5'-phosphate decarboxylase [Piscirickettsia salmonis]QGP51031.1 orotidine 5'-phosphate decarboxylase [Piscirickettsia salmonis]QGP55738.1 orotidine 5'-phosphate decarboxylase [Piscirickettsia salmonis]QGP58396.1 orotidine 5'-phosphate decarboxylase [Piscirickettsia salmonis]QGP65307.1 orotidine 5'-phosphate decarboxylase [Piscirickettsia salmonis]